MMPSNTRYAISRSRRRYVTQLQAAPQSPRDTSLITAVIAGCSKSWTMSVLADGPDEDETPDMFLQAQLDATIGLIERDHCVLYGCWGDYDDHVRSGACHAVIFPIGARVIAAYRGTS